MDRIPAAALGTLECKRRVMVPDKLLILPSASRSIYNIRAEYVLEFVSRGPVSEIFRLPAIPAAVTLPRTCSPYGSTVLKVRACKQSS